jgi:hypothetical protein
LESYVQYAAPRHGVEKQLFLRKIWQKPGFCVSDIGSKIPLLKLKTQNLKLNFQNLLQRNRNLRV